MRKGGGSKKIFGRDQKAFQIGASKVAHNVSNATPPEAPKHEEVFKQVISELKSRTATITDNTHNLSSGSGDTTRVYVQQQAGTMDQKTFDTMVGKSRLIDQIQVNVSTIQTQVWSILASVDGAKPAQESKYDKLMLIIIKVLHVMSVIWILLCLRCLITTIGT